MNALTHHAIALSYVDEKDYVNAINSFDNAIKLDPKNQEYIFDRALIKIQIADFRSALEDYNEVIRINPNSAKAYYGSGYVKTDLKKFFEAIHDYSLAIALRRNYADAYMNRAIILKLLGDKDGAESDTDKVIRITSSEMKLYLTRTNSSLNKRALYFKENINTLDPIESSLIDIMSNISINPQEILKENKQYLLKLICESGDSYAKNISEYLNSSIIDEEELDSSISHSISMALLEEL
jgi:tetratricopeptide (TPR) repeat protein